MIGTKIKPPRLGIDPLIRPRLLKLLEDYRLKSLTIVTAPAGYGKTILVSQFITEMNVPFIWYQLDSWDNSPTTFLRYLVAGITKRFPDLGKTLSEALENSDSTLNQMRSILVLLINEMELLVLNKLILILDNFHFIDEPLISQFIEQLIEYLPEKIHVVLLSRTSIKIGIHNMRTHGLVTVVTKEDLCFNGEETQLLLNIPEKLNLDDENIGAIEFHTEGWAVGLVYFRQFIIRQGVNGLRVNGTIQSPTEIYDYITAEIFDHLSPELRNFLICTSVFDEITPDVCTGVLGIANAADILDDLQEKNLLIPTMGRAEKGYRYHNQFKEYLMYRLGERRTEVYRRAGVYYQHRNPELAVDYFIHANEAELARQMMETIGIQVLQQGKLDVVSRWLDYIFNQIQIDSPWLILIKGALLSYQGLFDEAETWIDDAIRIFESTDDKTGLFHAVIHKSKILRYLASYDESIRYIDRIVPLLERMPIDQWYDVIIEKSFSLWLIGDASTAMSIAERAMNTAEKRGDIKTAWKIARYMTVLFYHTGDFTRALSNYQNFKLQNQADPATLERHTVESFIARIYRDRGELEEARRLMLQTLETKERLGMIEEMSNIYYQLATLFLDMKDYGNALKYLDLSRDLFKKAGAADSNAFFKLIQALKGRLIAETGDLLKGREMIEEAIEQLQGKSDFMLVVGQFFVSIVYIRLNQQDKALQTIQKALSLAEQTGMKFMVSQCSGLLAGILFSAQQEAIPYARKCLSLAAREHYVQMFITFPEFLPCIRMGLENGIEPDFVDELVIRLGAKTIPILLELIKSDIPENLIRSSHLLVKIGDEEVVRELSHMFYDSDVNVKNHAQTVLHSLELQNTAGELSQVDTRIRVYVRCFGEFEVFSCHDWLSPVHWRTAKAKELFAFFIHNNQQFISKETILAALWPDLASDHASALLHTNLFHVRKILKTLGIENGVLLNPSGYKLDINAISWDARVFLDTLDEVNQGRRDVEPGLKRAVSIYRGSYLKDWDWADTAREYYDHVYSSVLERLAGQCFSTGNLAMAEVYLKRLLELNPFLESAHQMLMKTYSRNGNHTGVTLQYNSLCRLLREELDVEPDEETQTLYVELCNLRKRK